MMSEIKMPQLGQTSDEIRLIKWIVKEGQEVKRGQALCEVETDKVTMELESVESGIITKLIAQPDSQIKTGEVIAIVENSMKAMSANREKNAEGKNVVSSKHTNDSEFLNIDDRKVPSIEQIPINTTVKTELKFKKNALNKNEKFTKSTPEKGISNKNILETTKVFILTTKEKKKILDEIGTQKAVQMYMKMTLIRSFEERIKLLFLEGKMPGTIHQYIGQEACAVGVCSALEQNDIIASTHRPHGHAIARGIPINEIMAELYGKTTGCCKGKGGSMHIGDLSKGMLPAIAIVGGNIPIVGGMAMAFKLKNQSRVAISFFGEGATNEGAFHEGLNMAAVYNIPAVFVCENNSYAASTPASLTIKIQNIAERACAYGMRGDIGDGMDVLNVYQHAKKAIDIARSGQGPSLLELKTFRLCGHSRRDPCNYMSKEEREYWKGKDPITLYEGFLLSESVLDKDFLSKIKNNIELEIDKAIEFGQNSPDPKPEDIFKDLYVDMEVPR